MELEYEARIRRFVEQGFNIFIGRSIETIKSTGYTSEHYTNVVLPGLGRSSWEIYPRNLGKILRNLFRDVKEGRKVLITEALGYIPPREQLTSNFVDLIRRASTGDDAIPVRKQWEVADPVTV